MKFENYREFAFCTIEENLHIAKMCLEKKKNLNYNAVYGMSALVLLASVIDTIGTFYRDNLKYKEITENDVINNSLGRVNEHFISFYDKFVNIPNFRDNFINDVYNYARCRATHNSVLGPNVKITVNKSNTGFFLTTTERKQNKGTIVTIHMLELYYTVRDAYKELCKDSGCSSPEETLQATTGNTKNIMMRTMRKKRKRKR